MNQDISGIIETLSSEHKIDEHKIRAIIDKSLSEVVLQFRGEKYNVDLFLNKNWTISYKKNLLIISDDKEKSYNDDEFIFLSLAKKNKKDAKIGDYITVESDFIMKRYEIELAQKKISRYLEEAKREREYEMFIKLENKLVEGIVRDVLSHYIVVEITNIGTAILFKKSMLYNDFSRVKYDQPLDANDHSSHR